MGIIDLLFPLPPNPREEWERRVARIETEKSERRRRLVAAFSRGDPCLQRGRYITAEQRDRRLYTLICRTEEHPERSGGYLLDLYTRIFR